MRKLAVPAALVLMLSAASPAFAGAGIPKIASVKVGELQANIYNSSPGVRTGPNTFTVEIPDLDHPHDVTLQLTGPGGQVVKVPLKKLTVLDDAEEAHGEEDGHDTSTTSKTTDHGHGGDDHAKAPAATTEDHGDEGHEEEGHADEGHGGVGLDTSAYLLRGTARLNATGDWKAVLEIEGDNGEKKAGSFDLHAEQGGPNRIFVSFSGLLMGGTILYGMVQRNRQSPKGGNR